MKSLIPIIDNKSHMSILQNKTLNYQQLTGMKFVNLNLYLKIFFFFFFFFFLHNSLFALYDVAEMDVFVVFRRACYPISRT